MARYRVKKEGFREPLVASAVAAVVALLAALNVNVSNDLAENVIDIASVAFAAYTVYKGRQNTQPVEKV